MAKKRPIVWEPGTVFDNIDSAVRHFGLSQPGLVWGLANVDWKSPQERDEFFAAVTRSPQE